MPLLPRAIVLCFASLVCVFAGENQERFLLVREGRVLPVFVEPEAEEPVHRAAGDLASDIASVAGLATASVIAKTVPSTNCILVGRVGAGGLIDRFVAEGKLDASGLKGAWEASVRAVVKNPLPGVPEALVIAGSDSRGAIFALYDISETIGVSPWRWWADVPVRPNPTPSVSSLPVFTPSPSVQYRGIFINDEDWGLQPWAEKTFEPEAGGIGPKTYAKVCELLLRLRANTLWPAMHACTTAFNAISENRLVADRYGIIMGSSHAEPMLRNNVREWTKDPHGYDYVNNREGVLDYWETRVRENGRFENIYTLGMRGIHDSAMQGVNSATEQKRVLEQIFSDQRALLSKHVGENPTQIPQIFCAYKEVLEVYRKGLQVPPDVTVVWPDDNFGYIRNFPSEAERSRPGGFGIYYHISYLGRPLAYLWLNTTPPALIWSEMHKAYELGARKLWIVNVGDIKPAEIGMEFFLQMARDITRWTPASLPDFLRQWAAREFGEKEAEAIARVMTEYYRLNFHRKPEHLQWWLPKEEPRPSPLSPQEKSARLDAFSRLVASAEAIGGRLPTSHRDAFFQLVLYPVRGSAAANERFFCTEEYERLRDTNPTTARAFAARAQEAQRTLLSDTKHYNEELAGGKWRHFMALEPADNQWKSMRIAPAKVPSGDFGKPSDKLTQATSTPPPSPILDTKGISPSNPTLERVCPSKGENATWVSIPGLGLSGSVLTVLPSTFTLKDLSALKSQAPQLVYNLDCSSPGEYHLTLQVLPTHPIKAGKAQRLAIAIDKNEPIWLSLPPHDGTPEWSRAVLESTRSLKAVVRIATPGRHTLTIYGVEAGLSLDSIQFRQRAHENEQP